MNQNEDQTREIQYDEEKVEQLRQCLEKTNFMGKVELSKYQNFWCRSHGLKFVLHYQAHFQARDSDIILASLPKTGTTWLKSLLFSIVNRAHPDHQPLNKKSDHAAVHLKKLAEFVGLPFSHEEVSEGVIDDIFELCSINNLKKLEVNKSGFMNKFVEKKNYFRKGEVGDWTNYFTPTMVEKINILMQQKLGGTGLSFELL